MRNTLPGTIRFLLTSLLLAMCAGCHTRYYAISDAPDMGEHIRTKYKYWIVDSAAGKGRCQLPYSAMMPDVFSSYGNGIPIEISPLAMTGFDRWSCYESTSNLDTGSNMSRADREVLQAIFGATGLWLIPLGIMAIYSIDFNGEEGIRDYIIKIPGSDTPALSQLRVYERKDRMTGLCLGLPIPYACYYGNPAPEAFAQGRGFSSHNFSKDRADPSPSAAERAFIYGLAARLKALEDRGVINEKVARNSQKVRDGIIEERRKEAAKLRAQEEERRLADKRSREEEARKAQQQLERQRMAQMQRIMAEQQKQREAAIRQTLQHPQPSASAHQAPYRIHYLERDSVSDFAYRFALELNGEPSIQTFFSIQKVFADEVRSAYHLEYPSADVSTLRIAVHPRLVNGRVEGSAEVLTINPISLSYDANTRRGKLSVRFNPSQYEEARAWARKNIETLARDKNIALVTGRLPPEATYYSLGETVKDGNILEIEFKTE